MAANVPMKDLDKIQERGSLRITTRQAVSLVAGVLLLLLLAFASGIHVGQVLAPAEAELTAPDVAAADRSIEEILSAYHARVDTDGADEAAEDAAALVAGSGAASDDPDGGADAVEPVPAELPPPSQDDPDPPTPEPPTPEPVTPEPSTPEPPTPAATVDPPRPTDGLPTPSNRGEFKVQLAAYPSRSEADELLARVTAGGVPAYVIEADVKGDTWYRVRVGRFRTRADASAWLGVTASFTPYDPIVVRD